MFIRGFFHIFSRRACGFHSLAKPFKLNFFIHVRNVRMNFSLNGQTRRGKHSSQPVHFLRARPLTKSLFHSKLRLCGVLEIPITFIIMFLGQGEEHHLLKCFRCSSILGSVTVEDSSLDMLDTSDTFSIHLYKHGISLRSSNLFRYGLSNSNAMY